MASASRPNAALALVFGLLAPGAGLWYAGRARTGGAVLVLFLASLVVIPLLGTSGVVDLALLPSMLRASAVALWAPSAVFGVVAVVTSKDAARPPWVHPWWVLGIVVASWALSFALRTRVVSEHIVTFAVIDHRRLEPEAKEGALVVFKRSYAPNELRPGALVLVSRDGKDQVARIVTTESGLVLDDGGKVSPADVIGVGGLAR